MILSRIGELVIEADERGWIARFPGAAPLPPAEWPRAWLNRSQDWQLAWQLVHLLELGIAVREVNTFRVPYSSFSWLLQQGFTLPLLWSTWSPLSLEVTMHGLPGQPGCCFSVRYFLGDLETAVDRHGRYIQRNEHEGTWLLDELGWQLLARIGTMAGAAATWSWPQIAFIRDLCHEACVTTLGFIADHEIIFPVSLNLEDTTSALIPRSTLQISEVPLNIFRRAMRSWSGESTLSFASREKWIHIYFDDQQIEVLHEWRANGSFHPPERAAVQSLAGRLGYRATVLSGNRALVPVRLAHSGCTVASQACASGHDPIIQGSSVRHFTIAQIQAALGCYFTARGYNVILTSEGCRTGASVLAIRDGSVLTVRIESPPCGDHLVQNAIRSTSALRRLVAAHYEPLIILRGSCPVDMKYRAEQQGIRIRDVYDLSDMIDSEPMTDGAIATASWKRCMSTGETVEKLKTALVSARTP